jgi:hypothetical protein
MPLILAIEPDRRQANQLNAVVKGRLHADLVLADSAERALAELGDRVPDLILTTALLSPTDEVVLGERLRALNGVAAHVQTLTIPVLASPRPHVLKRAGGMLSALRRGRQQQEEPPDGCDPTIFAAQCAEYLERAAAEQAANANAAMENAGLGYEAQPANSPVEDPWDTTGPTDAIKEFEAGVFEPQPIAAAIETMREPNETMFGSIDAGREPIESMREPVDDRHEPMMPTVPVTSSAVRSTPAVPLVIDAPAAAATVQHAIAQIEAYVAREALASETIAKLEADENAEETTEDLPEGFIELDLATLLEDPPTESPARRAEGDPSALESSEFDEDDELFVYDINDVNVGGDSDSLTSTMAAAIPAAKPAAKPARSEKPRQSVALNDAAVSTPTRLGVSQLWPPMDGTVMKPSSPGALAENRAVLGAHAAAKRQTRQKPIQDEWGFFDPEQCGFAALLAKLDEIIDKPA